MPLVPFSKILSSKTFARNSQLYSSSTVTVSPTVSPSASATETTSQQQQQQHRHHHNVGSSSLKTPPSTPNSADSLNNKSVPSWKGSTGRTRERSSKAFTFSLDPFNVVASLRTRSSKTKSIRSSHPESMICSSSRSVSHQSRSLTASVYSGYEDHEYGEPEVNAEEIRRPSGLGRRASITDMDMGDEVAKYHEVEQVSVRELRSVEKVPEETEQRNSVSDSSDAESLSEIRYPSGLGNIKLATFPFQNASDRPPSTYPLFEPDVPYYDTPPVNHNTSTPTATFPCSPTADPALASPHSPSTPRPPSTRSISASSYLSTLLPILLPYLPLQTLTSFARVDRPVGKVARDLLWRSIHMSVTIRSAQNPTGNTTKNKKGKMRISIDGRGHANGSNIDTQKLLDVICTPTASENGTTAEEHVACLVKSLEMTCRLDCSAPVYLRSSLSQRSRPPPLVLVPQSIKPPVRSVSPIPDPGQGAELAPTPSSPVPVPSEPRSVRQISTSIPGARSVNESAVASTGTNDERNVTTSHADVTPSSNKNLRRASLILRNSALTLRSMAHVKSNSTFKSTLPRANSTFIPTSNSNSPSSSSCSSKSNKTTHTNVPDALHSHTTTFPAAKPRPTSMRLPQSLSLFKSRSTELVGQTAGSLTSQTQNPSTPSSEGADVDTRLSAPPFLLFTRAPDTRWTAPPEWDRIAAVATANPSVLPSPPPSAPLPGTIAGIGTRCNAPSEWLANSSLSFHPTSFRTIPPTTNTLVRSSSSLLTHSPSFSANFPTHSHSHPDLHLSPSLPSLRAPTSPHLPLRSRSRSSGYADDAPSPTPFPSSPMTVTTVPSPITPYSAISLSAFPLPPPGTMPCMPLFPPECSSGFVPTPVASSQAPSPITSGSRSWSPSPSLAMSTSTPPTSAHTTATTSARDEVEESDLSPELAAALKKMVNLEHVTLKYISDSEYSADTGTPNSAQSPYTSMRESIHLSLVKKVNETLGNVLPSLESLKSLKVVCQAAPYDEVCRGWWEDATRPLENFELNVTCLPGC